MTREELKSRLIRVDGKVMPDKVGDNKKNRRGLNYIELQSDDSGAVDDFFEYEKELSGIESASSLEAKFNKSKPEQILEDKKIEYNIPEVIIPSYKSVDTGSFIVLEEETISFEESIKPEIKVISEGTTEIKSFEFKYCQYKKEDGTDCKRQAPKNGNYCSSHKKMVNKE